MSEGASIQAMCHFQVKRKVIEALDVSSTATRRHAGYCMSVREPAYSIWAGRDEFKQKEAHFLNTPEEREDRKSTRLNSSHSGESRMPSSA